MSGLGSTRFSESFCVERSVVWYSYMAFGGVVRVSFKEINIKPEYRSFRDDIVRDFYIPLLQEAVIYKRAVGFFSSTALIEISNGITGLVRNGGKVFLIASPHLSEEDLDAINKGFELKNEVIERVIADSIVAPRSVFEEERLNLLANLIADGHLEIKIAFTESNKSVGMFHEKVGLMFDKEHNIVAFSGSMNETGTAFAYNYESIDVFCSWTIDRERTYAKERAFSALWGGEEANIEVIDFPEVAKETFLRYRTGPIDLTIDETHFQSSSNCRETVLNRAAKTSAGPCLPEGIQLHDYQHQAIERWEEQGFVGIFDMATGTGKTYAGLGAVVRLSEHLCGELAVLIVCPYQHLVDQWVPDLELFGMRPIIGHSASSQRDWKTRLRDAVISYNLGVRSHFCFISTNATFSSDSVQRLINDLKGNILLLVDEAHNFGAERLSKTLAPHIPYRLALSATLERHGDEEGTSKLYEYFKEKSIEYTLKEAIDNGKLTPYYYYPKVVTLTEDEFSEYKAITSQVAKQCRRDRYGKLSISDAGKMLLIKRARLIAGAKGKLSKLAEIMEDYKEQSHILVYCGAATIRDLGYREGVVDLEEKRQIDVVSDMLGNDLNMRISKFTSEESAGERETLKEMFEDGHLQALVAIRCLDEGVNIPSIRTAFILASSTNPKEYVQRRGRVLRRHPGKSHATIYDFITIPVDLQQGYTISVEDLKVFRTLINREIARMKDFASIAENPSATDGLINELSSAFYLDRIGGEKDDI